MLMIKSFLLIVPILSFLFSSFYDLGDVINYEHQNIPIEICHGDAESIDEPIYIGEHNQGVTILGLASWG